MTLYARRISSPFGDLGLAVDAAGRLVRIAFLGAVDEWPPADADGTHWVADAGRTAAAAAQLAEYFAGTRRRFDLEVAAVGTPFQQEVWRYLRGIPAGETRSYSQIARDLGRPGAARAVGRANATNPIPVVVPCHRVIGADGSLTGFAGGLAFKRGLLALEAVKSGS